MARESFVVVSVFVLLVSSLLAGFPLPRGHASQGTVEQSNPDISPQQSSIASVDNSSAFAPVIANVQVRYPNDEPMPDAMVTAINQEYHFRCNEQTNASGWVILRAMVGMCS
ncbi:MAG: hypothetical protein MUP41_04100, partial [Desulfobacterales bacterium]|nr:hypothetical protein [Desulfobacterales bacterium]